MKNPYLFETRSYDERITDFRTDITLRDLFAAASLIGMSANPNIGPESIEDLPGFAFAVADDMLKARAEGK